MRISSATANKIKEKRNISPPTVNINLRFAASMGNKITMEVAAMATDNKNAIPLEEVCIYLLGQEFITHALNRRNIVTPDFLPDFTDMHIYCTCQDIYIRSPNIL